LQNTGKTTEDNEAQASWLFLTKMVTLLHENAHHHTVHTTRTSQTSNKGEVLNHPPYRHDVYSCKFHIFGPLQTLRGQWFHLHKDEKNIEFSFSNNAHLWKWYKLSSENV